MRDRFLMQEHDAGGGWSLPVFNFNQQAVGSYSSCPDIVCKFISDLHLGLFGPPPVDTEFFGDLTVTVGWQYQAEYYDGQQVPGTRDNSLLFP